MSFKGAIIFYRPRDVVSGDFYWFFESDNYKIIATVDCTGHSVPGAFMSMIANTLLNEIVKAKKIFEPQKILTELNNGVISTLHSSQNVEGLNDGMDISIYRFEENKRKAIFASANHVSLIFTDDKMNIIEGDMYSIGGLMENEKKINFTQQEVDLGQESMIYMFSDGFVDQFNDKGKKYMSKNFFKFLSSIHKLPIPEQDKKFELEFDTWRNDFRQIDDVLVIGLKV
jgi:serine phosphatase RsbU (regulator of sigma subunit)